MTTQVQAIHDNDIEGVPPARGYRSVYYYELEELLGLVSAPLRADLESAAAAHLERPAVKASGAFCFKFWPAPSQAGQLSSALAVIRRQS